MDMELEKLIDEPFISIDKMMCMSMFIPMGNKWKIMFYSGGHWVECKEISKKEVVERVKKEWRVFAAANIVNMETDAEEN